VNRITLGRVEHLPRELAPGILYVSEEFAVAGHLCACGCGNKVITPLGPAEWQLTERNGRPTLHPSVGNWQLPCRSHYVIAEGQIRWRDQWSAAQVAAGWRAEEQRRAAYYASRPRRSLWQRLWSWVRKLLGH
jgi:Family of unknown function (DUF6527)